MQRKGASPYDGDPWSVDALALAFELDAASVGIAELAADGVSDRNGVERPTGR